MIPTEVVGITVMTMARTIVVIVDIAHLRVHMNRLRRWTIRLITIKLKDIVIELTTLVVWESLLFEGSD